MRLLRGMNLLLLCTSAYAAPFLENDRGAVMISDQGAVLGMRPQPYAGVRSVTQQPELFSFASARLLPEMKGEFHGGWYCAKTCWRFSLVGQQPTLHIENRGAFPLTFQGVLPVAGQLLQKEGVSLLRPQASESGQVMAFFPQGQVTFHQRAGGMEMTLGANSSVNVYFGLADALVFQHLGLLDLDGAYHVSWLGKLALDLASVFYGMAHQVGWTWTMVFFAVCWSLLTWPATWRAARGAALMQQLKPQLQQLAAGLAHLPADEREQAYALQLQHLREDYGFQSPLMWMSLVQIAAFLFLWSVLRHLFYDGPLLGWVDPGLPDPFYVLPLLYSVLALYLLFVMGRSSGRDAFRQHLLGQLLTLYFFLKLPVALLFFLIIYVSMSLLQVVFARVSVRRQIIKKAP